MGKILAWATVSFGLLAQVAPAGASCEPAPANGGLAPLDFVWYDPAEALPFPGQRLGRELAAEFSDLGLAICWTDGRRLETATSTEFKVIFLARDLSPATRSRNVVGAVQRRLARSRAMWIMLPAARRSLGLPEHGSLTSVQERELARGLTHVVAHELVHTILPGRPHTSAGLMRRQLGRAALLLPRLGLDPASRQALMDRLQSRATLARRSSPPLPSLPGSRRLKTAH